MTTAVIVTYATSTAATVMGAMSMAGMATTVARIIGRAAGLPIAGRVTMDRG
jgi:hypothetical protein